jgi:DNA-binding Xre family transcriptional regulator
MSTSADLVIAIKKELKAVQMTYADLALELDMAESSVKRMLAKGDMPLSRIDAICRALKLDFAELARRVADAQPLLVQLTEAQEKAVVADKKLLLAAICVLSQWTLEQMSSRYRLTEAECIQYLAKLDHIGIIELKPLNRYRLKLAKTFRWRPHGAVMNYFRENALLDYFAGACSAWRRISHSNTKQIKNWPTKTVKATPCYWRCEAGSLRRLKLCVGSCFAICVKLSHLCNPSVAQ